MTANTALQPRRVALPPPTPSHTSGPTLTQPSPTTQVSGYVTSGRDTSVRLVAAARGWRYELSYFYLGLIGRDEAREIVQGLVQVRIAGQESPVHDSCISPLL